MTSVTDDRVIVRSFLKDRFLSAVEIKSDLKVALKNPPSEWTVRRRLRRVGLKAHRPRAKPLLTPEQKKRRLEWAEKHEHWTAADWSRVVWSDESAVQLFKYRSRWVWRFPREELDERCLISTVKHGGGKIMVWGAFTCDGVWELRKIEGKLEKKQYHSILVGRVMPGMRELIKNNPGVGWIFQQDNDPKHRAHLNQDYLKSQEAKLKKEFTVLDWPSQSPDMNPIENLWNIVKAKLNVRHPRPSSLDQLFDAIQDEWSKISKRTLKNLVESMPRRVQALLEARGGYTKY
jgi:hypothetical protein